MMGVLGRLTICVTMLLGFGLPALAAVQTEAELERIQALVAAGALPRRALGDAQREFLQFRYRTALRGTLLKATLTEAEIPAMIEASEGLRDIAKKNLDLVLKQVEAGALAANQLVGARDALVTAERQLELSIERAKIVRDLSRMASAESYLDELEEEELAFRFDGFDLYEMDALGEIDNLYYSAFGVPPPISADGDTALHRSMGLDHTGRVDIALHPDTEEGLYLIFLLEGWGIPYIAFRSAVPGQATGPHIHVGPSSDRIPVEPIIGSGEGADYPVEDQPAAAAEH